MRRAHGIRRVAAVAMSLALALTACGDADDADAADASDEPADQAAAPVDDEDPPADAGDDPSEPEPTGDAVAPAQRAPEVAVGGTLDELCDRAALLRRQGEQIGAEIGLDDPDAFLEAIDEANIAAFGEAPAEYRDDVQRVLNYLLTVSPYIGELIELEVAGGTAEEAEELTARVAEVQRDSDGLFPAVHRIESACEDEAGTIVYLEIYPL